APGVRARDAPWPGHGRAGTPAVGGSPAVSPEERPLAGDQRTLSPPEMVGRLDGAGRVPRPVLPERRGLVRPLGAAPAGVGGRDRPARRPARARGRRANSHEIRAVV